MKVMKTLVQIKNRLMATVVGSAMVLGFGMSAAQAVSLNPLLLNGAIPTFFEDNSAESIAIDLNGNGLLEVGDSLRGILKIQGLGPAGGTTNIDEGNGGGWDELAGVFEAVVVSRTFVSMSPFGDLYNYVFGPSAAFATQMEAAGGLAAGSLAGSMIALFTDPTHEFTVNSIAHNGGSGCTTTGAGGDCEANVIDGSLLFAMGMLGNVGESWVTFGATEDVGVLENVAASATVGFFNVSLSNIFNAIGTPLSAPPEWNGSGSIHGSCLFASAPCLASDRVSTYQATDDTDFDIRIPEPGTLGLLGFGLVGLAFARRRRKQA